MSKQTEEIRFTAVFCTSKSEYLKYQNRWEIMAEDHLRQQMAHALQREKAKTISTDDMIEKRLEVYCASPETFWKIVKQEAEIIARQFRITNEDKKGGD